MGGGATKEAPAPAPAPIAPLAQSLSSEIDNSKSLVHLNVHTTFVLGVVSLVILIFILLLLPCFCCKNVGRIYRWCCTGCQSAETRNQDLSVPWGVPRPLLWPNRVRYSQQDLEAWKKAVHMQHRNPQGSSALARPRPASEPTWSGEGIYPSVPSSPPPPPNTPNSSSEDIV